MVTPNAHLQDDPDAARGLLGISAVPEARAGTTKRAREVSP